MEKRSSPYRSPLFYVGDKYKLMNQLKNVFPTEIETFFDVFTGGGSVSLNTVAKRYIMNDINSNVIRLHRMLQKHSHDIHSFIIKMHNLIKKYNLSHSEKLINPEIIKLKKEYPKTYFAKYNKSSYTQLREDFNQFRSDELLYLLVVYGFNHMIRFNKNNEFNLPVGNVDWNKNVTTSLTNYSKWFLNSKKVKLYSLDFENLIKNTNFQHNDFLYLDPPYLITNSEYNKIWTTTDEKRMYDLLDTLNDMNIRWGLSNMLSHKNKKNELLYRWSSKYRVIDIKSNYISRFDNSLKKDSEEIYITNVN